MTTLPNSWLMPARLEMLLEEGKQWQWVYRPVFFRLDREEEQERFSHLLECGSNMLVYDRLQD